MYFFTYWVIISIYYLVVFRWVCLYGRVSSVVIGRHWSSLVIIGRHRLSLAVIGFQTHRRVWSPLAEGSHLLQRATRDYRGLHQNEGYTWVKIDTIDMVVKSRATHPT